MKKTLYFAGAEEDLLVPYPVEVEIGKDNVDTLHNVLSALIEGPKGEGYAPIIPKGAKLRAAFPGPDGIAYVDFDETFRDAHPGGAWAELMTAYGVANTVIRNFPDLFDRVVLLIGGTGGAEHRRFARHHGSAQGAGGVDIEKGFRTPPPRRERGRKAARPRRPRNSLQRAS